MRRSRSRRQQFIFSVLGLLVVGSMILSLILTVIPQPRAAHAHTYSAPEEYADSDTYPDPHTDA